MKNRLRIVAAIVMFAALAPFIFGESRQNVDESGGGGGGGTATNVIPLLITSAVNGLTWVFDTNAGIAWLTNSSGFNGIADTSVTNNTLSRTNATSISPTIVSPTISTLRLQQASVASAGGTVNVSWNPTSPVRSVYVTGDVAGVSFSQTAMGEGPHTLFLMNTNPTAFWVTNWSVRYKFPDGFVHTNILAKTTNSYFFWGSTNVGQNLYFIGSSTNG